MKREEIEKAAADYFRGLECPEPYEIAAFAIKYIKGALAEFADAYPCHCAQNYPGPTAYHGHDCQRAVVQEFVAQFAAHKEPPKA